MTEKSKPPKQAKKWYWIPYRVASAQHHVSLWEKLEKQAKNSVCALNILKYKKNIIHRFHKKFQLTMIHAKKRFSKAFHGVFCQNYSFLHQVPNIESHSVEIFLRDNISIILSVCLYNHVVAAVVCVCVPGEVWRSPFSIVKFSISIPRINHKAQNGVRNNRK